METITSFAVFYAICFAIGFPLLPWIHRGRAIGWSELLVESVLLGGLFFLLLVPPLLLTGGFSATKVAVAAVACGAVLWISVFWRVQRISWHLPWRPHYFLLVGLALVGFVLREGGGYFIYMTGDPGGYVNTANALLRSHELREGFPHLFPATLNYSAMVFGMDGTVRILPFLGMMSVLVLLAVGARLKLNGYGQVTLGAAGFLGLLPVWFSKFPASETLYAVLLLALLYFALRAIEDGSPTWLAGAGGFFLLLGLTRGNAILLIVILCLWLLVLALSAPELPPMRAGWLAAVCAAGFFLAYLYNITQLRGYYVVTQLRNALGGLYGPLERWELFSPGWRLSAVFALLLALLFAIFRVMARLRARGGRAGPGMARAGMERVGRVAAACMLGGLLLAVAGARLTGRAVGLEAFNLIFLALAAAGLALVLTGRAGAGRARLVAIPALVGLFFALFFAREIGHMIPHVFYLYWYRYAYGEVFWCTALVAGFGMHHAGVWLERRGGRGGRAGAWGILALLALAFLANSQGLTGRAMYQESYRQVKWIDETLAHRDWPIFFVGFDRESGSKPNGWMFPNLYRAYALPLEYSFGRSVENIHGAGIKPFGRDPRLDLAGMARFLAEKGVARAYLVAVTGVAPTPLPENLWNLPEGTRGGIRWRLLDSNVEAITSIKHKIDPAIQDFYRSIIRASVYEVSAAR